jgi:hypothetical protein
VFQQIRLSPLSGSVCWARQIGGCGGGISREHIISDAILAYFTDLTVVGYPWCRTEPKHIGPASLVAKDLCRSHNGQLSVTDSAAAIAFRVLGEQMDIAMPAYAAPVVINGFHLERWFLKTGINIALQEAAASTWPCPLGDARVPLALVQYAFGVHPRESPLGLYWRGHEGQKLRSEDRIDFAPLIDHGATTGGFKWKFRGHTLILWFHPLKHLVEGFGDRARIAGDLGSSLVYRVRGINLLRTGQAFCSLVIDWPDTAK